MPIRNASGAVDFDGNAVREAVLGTVRGTCYSIIEFDTETYTPLYVDDETTAMYDDREEMDAHFDRIHTHVHMDFMETQMITDLFPPAEAVSYMTTTMESLKLVRIYVDGDGLFVAVDPDEPVVPIVEAVRRTVDA